MIQPSASRITSGAILLFLLGGVIPLFVSWHTLSEHRRRVEVLAHGLALVGEVTAATADRQGRLRGCEVDYAFELDGMYTPVTAHGCRIMRRHPVGSEVQVRVEPKDKWGAMLVGESTWPIRVRPHGRHRQS